MKKIPLLFLIFLTAGSLFAQKKPDFSKLIPETPEQIFFIEYEKAQIKTQERLILMHKKSNLAKLGSEEVQGKISGTMSYSTKVEGFGGVVSIRYENYCDDEGYVFDGELITKSNMSANGSFDGCIAVKGLINGSVNFSKAILKNAQAGGGVYIVTLPDAESVELPYEWYFVAEEEYLKTKE